MDLTHSNSRIIIFDKHKSWYKMDIDGDFITKTSKCSLPAKKKVRTTDKKIRRPRPVYHKPVIPHEKIVIKNIDDKPESLSKSHEFIFRLGIHLCISLGMLITAYCGFSYVLPTQIILSNFSNFDIGVF